MPSITSAERLRETILERYDSLSPRLKDIARFLLDDPHSAGVETLAVISERVGVPPSAIVRFAKTFGFDGASPMQRLLKDGLLATQPASAYHERARQITLASADGAPSSDYALLGEFAQASSLSLDHVAESVPLETFEHAVDLVEAADTIYVAGFRRSFPIAAYLAYSLQQTGKRTILVDGVGGLARQQAGQARAGDLVIGISFSPYAVETVEILAAAAGAGATIAVVTDSVVGEAARSADCILEVRDTHVRGFRTLAASMCVAQSLAIAYAFRIGKGDRVK